MPPGTAGLPTQSLVTVQAPRHAEPIHERSPLRDEDRGNDEDRFHPQRVRDGQGDVRFAESHGIGQHGPTVSSDDRRQAVVGRDLVGREP
jgi:hypothetical protein